MLGVEGLSGDDGARRADAAGRAGADLRAKASSRACARTSEKRPRPREGSHNDAGRNQMRLTAIQAANAYALSPCDRTVKAAFVVAASTYMRTLTKSETATQALRRMRGCAKRSRRRSKPAASSRRNEFPSDTGRWRACMTTRSRPARRPTGGAARAMRAMLLRSAEWMLGNIIPGTFAVSAEGRRRDEPGIQSRIRYLQLDSGSPLPPSRHAASADLSTP